jgi:hypothetical protein
MRTPDRLTGIQRVPGPPSICVISDYNQLDSIYALTGDGLESALAALRARVKLRLHL